MDTVSFKSRRAKPEQSRAPQPVGADVLDGADAATLASVWRSVLRCDAVAPEDNFFELGGTSLHAMLMASRVNQQLCCELSLVAFFENPTFAGLCASIARSESGEL